MCDFIVEAISDFITELCCKCFEDPDKKKDENIVEETNMKSPLAQNRM